jgi:proline iminopeptidase
MASTWSRQGSPPRSHSPRPSQRFHTGSPPTIVKLPPASPQRESRGVERSEIPVDGGVLVATRAGTGPPALVVHGGPGLTDYTEGLAAELDGIYQCLRYQQRGNAPSDAPGPFSVDGFVLDAIAVLDAVGWDEATMIGHSWGALLAQHIVTAHPSRSTALIALDGLGGIGPDGGWGEMDKEFAERMPGHVAARAAEIDARLYAGEGSTEDAQELLRLSWPYYFCDPNAAPDMPPMAIAGDVYEQIHGSVLDAFARGHPEDGLRRFAKPALFLHGECDPLPMENARATAAVMPNATFMVLARCGHFPWFEKPGAVRDAIAKWTPRSERV